MAVYTEITDGELSAFLAAYNIGELLSFKGIAEGVENSNYLLHTSGGFYILTLYEKRVNADDLPYFMGLMEHLFQHDIRCPEPVLRKSGEVIGQLAGRPAAIATFLDGLALSNPTAANCKSLGEGMARMHLAGLKFRGFRANALSVDAWRPLFSKTGSGVDAVEPGLRDLIENELDFLEQNWPDDLPLGVIHADLFPDNVFFLKDRLSGFIDFYFSCNDMLAYDVAVCINAWCFDVDGLFNPEKAKNLMAGYQGVRKFNSDEIHKFSILIRGSAIRFLITRLYDWINTPSAAVVTPKKPDEYIDKLKYHQSIKDTAIYGAG